MPKIAELRMMDNAVWARIEMEQGSPIQLLSPDEIEANRKREIGYLDEIERLRAALRRIEEIYVENFCAFGGIGEIARAALLNQQSTTDR